MFVIAQLYFHSATLELLFYISMTTQWLPLLNPLASIFINRPYRDAVLGRFFKVTPMPQAN
jgi:hypothetical protein